MVNEKTKQLAVLAFSGGLDTSYCVLDLKARGYEVITAYVDTGSCSAGEAQEIESKALALGSAKHYHLDAADELWQEFIVPLLQSGALYQNQYPLLCSDRYLIVKRCLELCDELGSNIFVHGCTAMGNDQMRFDQTVRSLGNYEIIAPIRELQSVGGDIRAYEIEQLQKAGHDVKLEHKKYSINENILGVTWSGSEIDEFKRPQADTWKVCKPRALWPEGEYSITLNIESGKVVGVDGTELKGADILKFLNEKMGAYGVGKYIYTGDVVVGLKGRILFECPGVTTLMVAMQALLDVVMTKWQNQFRHVMAARWAELVYGGFFYEPHKNDIEAYLSHSVKNATGSVTVSTDGGVVTAVEVESDYMLVDEDSQYAQKAAWSPVEADGFIKLQGMSSSLAAKVARR